MVIVLLPISQCDILVMYCDQTHGSHCPSIHEWVVLVFVYYYKLQVIRSLISCIYIFFYHKSLFAHWLQN